MAGIADGRCDRGRGRGWRVAVVVEVERKEVLVMMDAVMLVMDERDMLVVSFLDVFLSVFFCGGEKLRKTCVVR
jgi:hypothetical protein